MKLPIVATPLSPEQMALALERAFSQEYGRKPTQSEAKWLLALARVENADGRAIIQHNWGNRVAVGSENYWVPKWADPDIPESSLSPAELSTRKRYESGGQVPGRFAAYPSHEVGARKYVRLFKSQTHARILNAAFRDDAEAFWRAIWTPHPITKRVYCVECGTDAAKRAYSSKAADSARFFDHLPKADPPAA